VPFLFQCAGRYQREYGIVLNQQNTHEFLSIAEE
jgi:hypothetical protein